MNLTTSSHPRGARRGIFFFFLSFLCTASLAQSVVDAVNGININEDTRATRRDRTASTLNDSTKTVGVPYGIFAWQIEERFGGRIPSQVDTLMTRFPQRVFTAGPTMRYNTTGNLGAPRMSRIYNGQDDYMMGDPFIFSRPYDYYLLAPSELLFTNTKSPYTNLTYNKCGNRTDGEDRINAKFAVNIGKKTGLGFHIDYLYGRGYYQNQNTAHFGGTLYGSHINERYELHALYNLNHLKNAENGGLESDDYITHPELLPTSFRMSEMPVRLRAYNYMYVNTLFLSHRYHLGGYEEIARDTIHVDKPAADGSDSIRIVPRMQFRPVASIIHTMRLAHNNRRFLDSSLSDKYFADYYLPEESTNELTRNFSLDNTLALEMREGFRQWVKTGMRLFAKHQFDHFVLLDDNPLRSSYNENHVTLGAQLMREQGRLFHYNVIGEIRTSGKEWGEFNAEGWAKFDIPLRRDSLSIKAKGYVRNEQPSFYFRHYHGRNAWWDDDELKKVFRTRIGGELKWWKTRVEVNFETIQNYTHFGHIEAPTVPVGMSGTAPLYSLRVMQAPENIQTLEVSLFQNFSLGPLRWENELTLQKSSSEEHLPLPLFTGYTNLYLKFCIAKVLHTELGADARYFTRYYAPDYAPAIGQFATQSLTARSKIGNYPWINVYVNFLLKRARFYVMYTHVNKTAGNYFLTPHYPTNERVLRLGVSWSFIN